MDNVLISKHIRTHLPQTFSEENNLSQPIDLVQLNQFHHWVNQINLREFAGFLYVGNYGVFVINPAEYLTKLHKNNLTNSQIEQINTTVNPDSIGLQMHFNPMTQEPTLHAASEELRWCTPDNPNLKYAITQKDIQSKYESAAARFYACMTALVGVEMIIDDLSDVGLICMGTNLNAATFFHELGFLKGEISGGPSHLVFFTKDQADDVMCKGLAKVQSLINKYPFLLGISPNISNLSQNKTTIQRFITYIQYLFVKNLRYFS